jgi:hypothetical protein
MWREHKNLKFKSGNKYVDLLEADGMQRETPELVECNLPIVIHRVKKFSAKSSKLSKKVETMFGESFFRPSDQLLNAKLFHRYMNRFP